MAAFTVGTSTIGSNDMLRDEVIDFWQTIMRFFRHPAAKRR